MRHTFFSRVIILSVFLASGILKADGITITNNLKLSGYSFWQFGQIVKGDNSGKPIEHQWTNGALLGFTIEANPIERLKLVLSPEFKLNYPFPEDFNHPETVRPFGLAYINNACGILTFLGDPEKPILELATGMFTYKYNPDVRHLGEFLFRTGTYPMYILTDFDFAKTRLVGLRLTTNPIDNLHADVLLTSEAFIYPLYDFSLSGIIDYKLFDAIDIGGGIDFARLIPVVKSKTSPKFTKEDKPAGYNQYIKTNGIDTGYYSFKATKIMGRLSIDIKHFFGSPKFFGDEDLKLYGEIMLEDPFKNFDARSMTDSTGRDTTGYPAIYNEPGRRMPMMIGLNLPTHQFTSYCILPGVLAFALEGKNQYRLKKMFSFETAGLITGFASWLLDKYLGSNTRLDLISFELEYFPSMLPNEYGSVVNQLSPIPTISGGVGAYNPNDYNDGAWRWSIYAKKSLVKGLSITGMASFDHLRTTYWNGATQFFSCMNKKGQWHWDAKIGYSF